ncbi:uncharacterized protein [Prorops nasuta]|uniref:uncharacterized protein n=1 Tax=Prorops nasuta TaxID=863751 RepID=UPI0034CF49C1
MEKVGRGEGDGRKKGPREGSEEARGGKGVEKLKIGKLRGWGGGMGRMRSGSVGSVEEFTKGKRKEREEEGGEKEEESWVFSKTAKVMRTPEKREEDPMERMMKALEGIKVRMDGWEEGKREIIEKVEEVKEEIKKGDREKEREKERKEKQRGEGEGEKGGIERRIRRLEWEREKKERGERRNNIIVWGLERTGEGEEEIRGEVEKILRMIGVEDAVLGVRRIGGVGKGGRKGVEVKLKDKEVKRKVMEGK